MRAIDTLVIHRYEVTTGTDYNMLIGPDGAVDVTGSLEQVGAHAVGWNHRSLGIAAYGCFDPEPESLPLAHLPHNLHPTPQQLAALETLVLGLCWWLGKRLYVAGHTELPNASRFPGKRCPGRYLDMDALRALTGTELPPLTA